MVSKVDNYRPMMSSTVQKFLEKKKQYVNWRKIRKSKILTDTLYKEQLIICKDYRLKLFDFVREEFKSCPRLSSDITSGIIIKSELYVVTCTEEHDRFIIYKINLDRLDTWIECKVLSNKIVELYKEHNIDKWDFPSLHKFGNEDLFISTCGFFMSYKFHSGESKCYQVPPDHRYILAVTAVEEKIYVAADHSHKICEIDAHTQDVKEIVLQDVSNASPRYKYGRGHHKVSRDTQTVNNLQVYRNRYILLHFWIYSGKKMKWRFIIYDTKRRTIESSRFYRMYHERHPYICYGFWIGESYLFYEYFRHVECYGNFVSIFNIQEIVGNYRTVETWILVKELMEKGRLGNRVNMEKEFDIIVNVLKLNHDLFRHVIEFLLTPGVNKFPYLEDRLDETSGNEENQFYLIDTPCEENYNHVDWDENGDPFLPWYLTDS